MAICMLKQFWVSGLPVHTGSEESDLNVSNPHSV